MYFCVNNCTSPSNDYTAVVCSDNNQAQLHTHLSAPYWSPCRRFTRPRVASRYSVWMFTWPRASVASHTSGWTPLSKFLNPPLVCSEGCQCIVVVRWTGQIPLGWFMQLDLHTSQNHCLSILYVNKVTHSMVKTICFCSTTVFFLCKQQSTFPFGLPSHLLPILKEGKNVLQNKLSEIE